MTMPKFDPIRDVLSGILMAVTSIPQLISYAEIVGYPGHVGLSTSGPPLFAWGLFTASPYANAGVTSLTATMVRNDLDPYGNYVNEYGMDEYVYLVSCYSLYVGLTSSILALSRFGNLARRVPESIRAGFKWGCEVGILTSALPAGLYLHGYTTSFLERDVPNSYLGMLSANFRTAFPNATGVVGMTRALYALTHPLTWDVDAIFVFVNCVLFITLSRGYILPSWSPPGSEVLLATIFATAFGTYTAYPGGIVGDMPARGDVDDDAAATISMFGTSMRMPFEVLDVTRLMNVPIVERCFGGSYYHLLLSASIFSMINYLSIVAISTGFEKEDGVPWSASRELLAQGASNVVAGFVGSAPVSGSMSRSLVSRMTGSTSRLACLVTSVVWMVMMPYMSIMRDTPKSALCAVITSAVLANVFRPTGLFSLRGKDAFVGYGTAFASSTMNPTMGFVFGCILHVSVLGGMKSKEMKKSSKREKAE